MSYPNGALDPRDTQRVFLYGGYEAGGIGPVALTDGGYFYTVVKIDSELLLKSAPVNLTVTGSGGSGIIVGAIPNKKIRVYAVGISTLSAVSTNFRSGLTTVLEGPRPFVTRAGYTETVTPPAFLFETAVGDALYLTITGAGSVYGRISYWIE